MDTSPDLQTHTDDIDIFGDYLMGNAFDSPQPEVDAGPPDGQFEDPHMQNFDELPAFTSYDSSQAVNRPLAVHRDSYWDGIIGNEPSQSTRYWQSMRSPQSVASRQCNGVCPNPTSLPSRPQSFDYYAMGGIESCICPLALASHNPQSTVDSEMNNRPLRPRCDYRCYPPPNVGLLSRRFEENEDWIRGRSLAVSLIVYRKPRICLLPVEILMMIASYFHDIDPFTSLGGHKDCLQVWNSHRAFTVLAATCRHLRGVFHDLPRGTRVVTPRALPRMAELFKEVEVQVRAELVRTFITQLSDARIELLRDCLLALPSLHTLGIVDDAKTTTQMVEDVFRETKTKKIPNITKVAIPVCAHPILRLLPKVEELACYKNPTKNSSVKSVVTSSQKHVPKEGKGGAESVLKSFIVIAPHAEPGFATELVKKVPKLRKLCLPLPSEEDMETFTGLKGIVEFEILIHTRRMVYSDYLESIKSRAIKILQASECHKDCRCKYKCGCAETNNCRECSPPKRFLRIKESSGDTARGPQRIVVEKPCQEIEVSPQRVLTK